jgi:CARDB protein
MATQADLVPTNFSATSAAPNHANIVIGFGVKNQGAVTAIQPWYDYVLWSTDQVFGGDSAIGVIQHTSNVPVNGTYIDNGAQQVQIPNVAPGTYYLYFQTDGANFVPEGNESNNWTGPIGITVSNADLSPTALTIPAAATINVQFTVSYSIKDLSATVPAYGPWNDQLYLSSDTTLDGGDLLIGSFSQSGVSANTTYSLSQPVTIPPGTTPGSYYVILKADGGNDYYETNESNNLKVSASPMTVS